MSKADYYPESVKSDLNEYSIRENDEGAGYDTEGGDDGGDSGQQSTGADDAKEAKDETSDSKEEAKSKLTDSEAKLLKDVMKWKEKARNLETSQATLSSKLSEAEKASNALKSIQETIGDVKIEDLKSLVDSRKDAERKSLEDKGQYDKILEQIKQENGTKISTLESQLKEHNEKLASAKHQIEELTLGRSFSDSKFIQERSILTPRIALREFGSHFSYEDGKVIAYDKPTGTDGRVPLVDENGDMKPFDVAIEQLYGLHPDKDSLLRSTKKPGAKSKSTESKNTGKSTEQLRGRAKISAGLSALNN